MTRRLALVPALGIVLVAASALAAQPPPSVPVSDPAVGVGCADGDVAHTGDVAVAGGTVAALWTLGDDAGLGLAVSRDGGGFSHRAVPMTACTGGPLEVVLDPDVAVGADGTTWVSGSGPLLLPDDGAAVVTGDDDRRLLVQVGDTPAVPVVSGVATERGFLETDPTDADRALVLTESLTSASAAAGPFVAGQFVPGGPEGSLLLARTEDRGRSWQTQVVRPPSSPLTGVLALGLVRQGDVLVALSVEYDLKDPAAVAGVAQRGVPRAGVAAQRSTDGGATWSAPAVLGVEDQATLVDAAAGPGLVAVAAPQHDGRLLVWTSEDAGVTWRRTTATTGVAQPSTAVAVDETGRLGVLSYRVDGDRLTPQLSTTTDAGRTWADPVPLAPSFSATDVRQAGHVAPLGPYQGAAPDGRDLLVAFTAEGPGGRTEVRLARVGQPG